MATFTIKKSSKDSFHLNCEFQGFPLTFVNGLRRVLVGEYLPSVVLRDINILVNTTQMPHEMIKHRMELLPININYENVEVIKNALVELKCFPIPDKDRVLTTDDFVIEKGPKHLLMKDRDLDKPLVFIKVRKGEEVHVTAKLAVEKGSQVCTSSQSFHIDPERAKIDKEEYMKKEDADERVFDNFYIQKSYSVDDHGRPNWIDFSIESVGVYSSKDLLKMAVQELKKLIDEWINEAMENISRESEKNVYSVNLKKGGHTEGALLQESIYALQKTDFVGYDILHPLVKELLIKFVSDSKPEDILKETQKHIHDYCELIEKAV